ncbi:MAG: sulfite exporter TauE/SafE family protein [Nitrososphaerales archaeon]
MDIVVSSGSELTSTLFVLAPLFFATSFVYSSVGFGGGSSYIAILVLAGVSLFMVPPLALILNIIVATIALIHYARAGHLSLSFSAPFLSSIPFAFVSGLIVLSQKDLALIFVIALFAASAVLITSASWIKRRHEKIKKLNISQTKLILVGIPAGATLGSVAGIVGIGGGIWLSPLLILTGLADPKRAAATASLFILTNSISGFVAHSISKPIDIQFLIPLALVVLAGGLIGSRLGAFKFNHDKIRIIVGALVSVAAIIITFNQLLSV